MWWLRRAGSHSPQAQFRRRVHRLGRLSEGAQNEGRGAHMLRNHGPYEARRRISPGQFSGAVLRDGTAGTSDLNVPLSHIAGAHVPRSVQQSRECAEGSW